MYIGWCSKLFPSLTTLDSQALLCWYICFILRNVSYCSKPVKITKTIIVEGHTGTHHRSFDQTLKYLFYSGTKRAFSNIKKDIKGAISFYCIYLTDKNFIKFIKLTEQVVIVLLTISE